MGVAVSNKFNEMAWASSRLNPANQYSYAEANPEEFAGLPQQTPYDTRQDMERYNQAYNDAYNNLSTFAKLRGRLMESIKQPDLNLKKNKE